MTLALASPTASTSTSALREALALHHESVRENGIVPTAVVIAIIVLLLLAASIVAAAIILCAHHWGDLDGVASLNTWTVEVTGQKL